MGRKFHIEQLDQNKFIKVNDSTKEITNPSLINATTGLTPDGLLSNEIFGITKEERSGIYGYIDLKEYFIQPYYYKIWLKLDRNLKGCIYETQTYKIDAKGFLVQDDNSTDTGLAFIRKNLDKLKFKDTKQQDFIKALMEGKKTGLFFTNKMIVTPPFYRDIDTSKGTRIGVGEINKLYITLINKVKALNESTDYGFDIKGGIRGEIQDVMLEIYNWYTLGESIVGGEHTGSGIFKKFGTMRRSVMAKTTDNSARLVVSAVNINVNSQEDLICDMDYSAIPLAAALSTMYPFVIYWLRQFFINEFGGKTMYDYIDSKGNLQQVELENPMIEFSDDRFDKEINEFIHGYANRFKRVEVPNKEGKKIYMKFKGYSITRDEYKNGVRENNNATIDRYITWVDLFYMACCESAKDKVSIIARYPIDSYFNQLYTKIHIYSTVNTEPMVINGEFYQWYPKIRNEDIGSNTSNKFIDTASVSNPYCVLMGMDYDGDTISVKVLYSTEANEELEKYRNTNAQYITLAGRNGRTADKESIQAIYNLTLVLPETKLKDPIF